MKLSSLTGVCLQALMITALVGCAASRPAPVENRAVQEPAHGEGRQAGVSRPSGRSATAAAPLGARQQTEAAPQPAEPGQGVDITFTPTEVVPAGAPAPSPSAPTPATVRRETKPDLPQRPDLPRRDAPAPGDESPDAVLSLLNQANTLESRGNTAARRRQLSGRFRSTGATLGCGIGWRALNFPKGTMLKLRSWQGVRTHSRPMIWFCRATIGA